MANVIKHKFTSAVADSADTTQVRPSNWNDEHALSGGSNLQLLQRDTGESDGASWTSTPTVTAIRFLLSAPGSPQNGDMWMEVSGVSPSREVKLYFRDGSTTILFHTITY